MRSRTAGSHLVHGLSDCRRGPARPFLPCHCSVSCSVRPRRGSNQVFARSLGVRRPDWSYLISISKSASARQAMQTRTLHGQAPIHSVDHGTSRAPRPAPILLAPRRQGPARHFRLPAQQQDSKSGSSLEFPEQENVQWAGELSAWQCQRSRMRAQSKQADIAEHSVQVTTSQARCWAIDMKSWSCLDAAGMLSHTRQALCGSVDEAESC